MWAYRPRPVPMSAHDSLPSAHSSTEPHWPDYAVLVVDDEAGMRSFLERALSVRGCTVASADSAEAGAALLAKQHFDAVVLDIALPGKPGITWLHELRAGGFSGDVVLITAFADMETAIEALRAGASDFILKPFRVDQILNSLRRCFERARLEIFGMPLAFLPVFEIADPTVKQKSGFLTPSYHSSSDLGYGARVPYYWALSPTYDITFYPAWYSKQGFLGMAEWRQRFNSGQYSITVGGIKQRSPEEFYSTPAQALRA